MGSHVRNIAVMFCIVKSLDMRHPFLKKVERERREKRASGRDWERIL